MNEEDFENEINDKINQSTLPNFLDSFFLINNFD